MDEFDEILAAAQENPVAESEDHALRKATKKALIITLFAFLILALVEILAFRKVDFGKPMLLFLFSGILDICEGKQLEKRKEIVRGTVLLIIAVLFALLYIGGLFR